VDPLLSRGRSAARPEPLLLLLVTGVTLVALALRLYALPGRSIWFDEAVSVGFAALPWPELLKATSADVNPPLYYLLLHLWLPLAGDESWLRLPSVLTSAAAVGLTVWLTNLLFSRTTACVAGLLTACSSLHVALAQEARAYGLLSLLAVAAIASLWRLRTSPGRTAWLLFVATGSLALYTHNYAAFLLVGLAVWCLIDAWLWPSPNARAWRLMVLAFAAIGALYLPWVPVMLSQVGTVRADYWIEPSDPRTLLQTTYFALVANTPPAHGWGTDPLDRAVRWTIPLLVGVSVGTRLVAGIRARGGAAATNRVGWTSATAGRANAGSASLLVLLAVAGPIGLALGLSQLVAPLYVVRYVGFVLPLFWIIVADGLRLLPGRRAPLVGGAVLLVGVALNLPPLYHDSFYGRSDFRAAARTVLQLSTPGELVVHTSAFTQYPFAYYDRDQLHDVVVEPESGFASGERDPAALGLDAFLGQVAMDRRGFWYVASYDVQDENASGATAAEATRLLRGWEIEQQHAFLGLLVYHVRQPRQGQGR
jgi:hypothetical protein